MESKIYIFKDINWRMVPNCALKDLIDIYADCLKDYQVSLPSQESLQFATDLYNRFLSSKSITPDEQKLKIKMQRRKWTNKLYMGALYEFKQYMDTVFQDVLGVNFKLFIEPYYETKDIIFLDYLIRHPGIMDTYNKLSKLRCKTRKLCNLPATDYVGF